MKYYILLIIIFLSFNIYAYNIELIDSILNNIYLQDYDRALQLSNEGIKTDSKIPYYYLKTGIFTTYMSDFETDKYEDSLFHYFEIVKHIKAKTAFDYFFKGGVYFQKGSYLALKGNYIGALKHSLKAKTLFNLAIEKDSTLYDAYLGMGLYNYFLSKFKSKISFYKTDYKGIDYIKKAAFKGLFSKIPAFDMLAIIYTYEENYDSAMYYIKRLRELYPKNRMFLFTHYKLLLQMEDYNNALFVIDTLTAIIEETQKDNMYNLAYCYYNKALIYYYLYDYEKSKQYANRVIALKGDNRIKKFINESYKLLRKIDKN